MCASVLGTWSFSLAAVQEAVACVKSREITRNWRKERQTQTETESRKITGSGLEVGQEYGCIHCLEKGINVVEEDPEIGRCGVGRGALPNADGILECDAAIMYGNKCKFGAVTAIQGVATPFSVARLVMERSPHNMLTGSGAQNFAKQFGITVVENEDLQTEYSKASYQDFLAKSQAEGQSDVKNTGHDTIGLIVKDFEGNIAAGTSTSGMPFKFSGRVGDSALPGAGLYADNQAGAATASGDGDSLLRFCPCFNVVQLMKQFMKTIASEAHSFNNNNTAIWRSRDYFPRRNDFLKGAAPKEACRRVIKDIWKLVGRKNMFRISLIAVNTKGEHGMASTVISSPGFPHSPDPYPGFAYCHWSSEDGGDPEIQCEPSVLWEHVENDT